MHATHDSTSDSIRIYHFPSLSSTMDKARDDLRDRILVLSLRNPFDRCFAVSATKQLQGRGTKGRQWISPSGNCHVTIIVPTQLFPLPITMIPLKVSCIVASHIHSILHPLKSFTNYFPKVTVKWPNDILVNQEKVSGILIEKEKDYLLIGIGINVKHAPSIPKNGINFGRPSSCIYRYLPHQNFTFDGVEESKVLAHSISNEIYQYLEKVNDKNVGNYNAISENIINGWEKWTEYGIVQKLRDKPGNPSVIPLGLELDGRLRVNNMNGNQELLCVDYLF